MSKLIAIPTIHPALLLRDQALYPVVISDLKKSLIQPPENYNIYPSLEETRNFNAKTFSFDIENNRFTGEVYMVGLAADPYTALCVPFKGSYIKEIQRIFAGARTIIGHNIISHDIPHLEKAGVVFPDGVEIWDTILMHHLISPQFSGKAGDAEGKGAGKDTVGGHSLEFISSIYCNKPKWKHQMEENKELYCCRDTDVTLQIFQQLLPLLRQFGLEDTYRYVSIPMALIAKEMKQTGFRLDNTRLSEVRERLLQKSRLLEQVLPSSLQTHQVAVNKRILAPPGALSEKTGKPIKYLLTPSSETVTPWRSDLAVGEWLYTTLGLPVQKHIKTGKQTTDKTAMEKLGRLAKEKDKAAIKALKELRSIDETLTTFAKEKMQYGQSVHANFNVHGTSSGRLSSSEPNMQNIPEETRCIYIPSRPGWKVVQADYSQIENRLTAHLAGDNERLQRFLANSNFSEHRYAASLFFRIPYEEVEKDNDKEAPYGKAKRIVHGCWSDDAEFLTPAGWVPFPQYKEGMEIAEWSAKDSSVSFRQPKSFIEKEVEGTLLEFNGRAFKAKVTWNHSFPCGKQEFEPKQADSIKSARIPTTGEYSFGDEEEIDVKLAAAIQADAAVYGTHPVFHFHRERKMRRLESILPPAAYNKTRCGCGLGYKYGIYAAFAEKALTLLTDKSFNSNILKLTREKAEELLEEVTWWDGTRGGKSGRQKSYISTDKTSIIWIQTLSHLLGRQALLREKKSGKGHFGKKPVYQLSFNRRKLARKYDKQEVNYKGKIYCFKTTTGYFLVRYKDTIVVSGNTNYGMGPRKIANMYDMSEKECRQLQKQWKEAISATSKWQEETAARAKEQGFLVNPFGRRQWFYTSDYFTKALSFIPQSSAADIILRAMVAMCYERIGWSLADVFRVAQVVKPLPRPARLLASVHDSLVFECPAEIVDELVECITQVMTQPWRELSGFACPISVECGGDWGPREKGGSLEKYTRS